MSRERVRAMPTRVSRGRARPAPCAEPVGEAVGAGVELGVGEGGGSAPASTKTAAGAAGVRAAQSSKKAWMGRSARAGRAGAVAFQAASWACFGAVSSGRLPMGGIGAGRTAAASSAREVAGHARGSSPRRTGRRCTRTRRRNRPALRRPTASGRTSRPACIRLHRAQREPGQVHAPRRHVLHREHDLEERAVAHAAVRGSRLQRVDQHLEGQVLVGVRAERGLARHAPAAAGRSGCPPQPAAHDQRVDEEADQVLRLALRAVRDGRADRDVVLVRCSGAAAPGRPRAAS